MSKECARAGVGTMWFVRARLRERARWWLSAWGDPGGIVAKCVYFATFSLHPCQFLLSRRAFAADALQPGWEADERGAPHEAAHRLLTSRRSLSEAV